MKNKKEISWQAPEYIYYPKTLGWYLGLFVIGLVLIGYSLWTKDYLLTAVLGIIITVFFIYGRRPPKTVQIKLSGQGLTIDDASYSYSSLKSFWIIYQPPAVKTLNFETTSYLNRDITLQLADQDPNEVREYLLRFLPEDLEREESYFEKLLRSLRF